MSECHVKLINVKLTKITESGVAAIDQVRNNSWVVSAGLPAEVQGGEKDFDFEKSPDGNLIGDGNFVADASEVDPGWMDHFDLVVGGEMMKCVFADSFTGVLVFQVEYLGKGKKVIPLPRKFLVFQAGNPAALYSFPDVQAAWAAAISLVKGEVLSAKVKRLSLSAFRRRSPRP
ncbi:hypothetical protein J7432_14140 [Xanthomonas axonopodis pv. begoniae]|nr:hypothetical protein [Xanthomonas axonopodis pv. begoniae]MBO9774085.1 hypothetical protein [Xanthomonas axonopodis pv. begoniae]